MGNKQSNPKSDKRRSWQTKKFTPSFRAVNLPWSSKRDIKQQPKSQTHTSSRGENQSKQTPPVSSPRSPAGEGRLVDLGLYYDVDWSPAGVLGKGHYAVVYKGVNKATMQEVAVKQILRKLTRLETLQTEVRALRKVKGHPNIVNLYDVFFDDQYVVLVMELLAGGELFDRIVASGAYSERDASVHTRKIASALKYMHSQGIVHRDLKPENLVLQDRTANSEIKISDFGLSKILRVDQTTMQTVCGTRAYSAPEVNFGGKPRSGNYNSKVDTWSLGVILYVILAAYHPFDPFGNSSDHEIWHRISIGQWDFNDPVWQSISPEAKDLITKLLKVDVGTRMSSSEILNHPWIRRHNDMPRTPLRSLSSRKSLRLGGVSEREVMPFTEIAGTNGTVTADAVKTQDVLLT